MAVVAAVITPPTSPTLEELSDLILSVSMLDPIADASPVKMDVFDPNTPTPL